MKTKKKKIDETKKNKYGRSRASYLGNTNAEKKIPWAQVDSLLKIGCTGEEIAEHFGVHYDTIVNHCKKEHGCTFSEYLKTKATGFHMSIRRMQFKMLTGERGEKKDGTKYYIDKPSVAMAIFLGKNYLGQTDKQELSNNPENPLNIMALLVASSKAEKDDQEE